MELRQLIYFEAVARYGGFSRAAEQLHIAQPAISAQIKRLEKELGTVLLERTTRRQTLTPAGELFLARAREVLAHLDAARADLDELAAVLRGSLRIGATQVLGSLDLPHLLSGFHRRYPGVSLALRTGLIADLLNELDSAALDIVLGPIHADLPANYLAQPLARESLVLITPPGQHIHATPAATLAGVRDQPFICLPPGTGLHGILLAAAEAEGFTPHIPFEVDSPASVRNLVAAGLGVALIAESAALAVGPTVDVHPLRPAPQHPPIGMIRARSRPLSPAARAWQQHLETSLRPPKQSAAQVAVPGDHVLGAGQLG